LCHFDIGMTISLPPEQLYGSSGRKMLFVSGKPNFTALEANFSALVNFGSYPDVGMITVSRLIFGAEV